MRKLPKLNDLWARLIKRLLNRTSDGSRGELIELLLPDERYEIL